MQLFSLYAWQPWFAWYPVITYDNHARWLRTVKRRLCVYNQPNVITYWQYSD